MLAETLQPNSAVMNTERNVKHLSLTCVSFSKSNSWYWWAAEQQQLQLRPQTWARNPESHKRWLFVPAVILLHDTEEAAATHMWFSERHK